MADAEDVDQAAAELGGNDEARTAGAEADHSRRGEVEGLGGDRRANRAARPGDRAEAVTEKPEALHRASAGNGDGGDAGV